MPKNEQQDELRRLREEVSELKMDDGTAFLPNDYYNLTKETFRLYYTSGLKGQQVIDVYFFDNTGNTFDLSFSFNNDNSEK